MCTEGEPRPPAPGTAEGSRGTAATTSEQGWHGAALDTGTQGNVPSEGAALRWSPGAGITLRNEMDRSENLKDFHYAESGGPRIGITQLQLHAAT